ncbi:MAG: bacterioferritin-associated ferredoxin [Woeseia sp.]
MYVCLCNAVTDKQIRRAAARGVDNLYELREHLGVASSCGSCTDHARSILSESGGSSHARPSMVCPATA